MKGNAPERLVSGSDDFTMFLWEPAVNKHPKTRMTGHQQVLSDDCLLMIAIRFFIHCQCIIDCIFMLFYYLS